MMTRNALSYPQLTQKSKIPHIWIIPCQYSKCSKKNRHKNETGIARLVNPTPVIAATEPQYRVKYAFLKEIAGRASNDTVSLVFSELLRSATKNGTKCYENADNCWQFGCISVYWSKRIITEYL